MVAPVSTSYAEISKLVFAAQQGDREALHTIWFQYLTSIKSLLFRYCIPVSSREDVLQEIFILYMNNIKQIKRPTAIAKWLQQMTRRYCWSFVEKSNRGRQALLQTYQLASDNWRTGSEATRYDAVDFQEIIQMIRESLLQDKPKLVNTFIQFFIEERTIKSIAKLQGRGRSFISKQVQELRAFLKENFPDQLALLH